MAVSADQGPRYHPETLHRTSPNLQNIALDPYWRILLQGSKSPLVFKYGMGWVTSSRSFWWSIARGGLGSAIWQFPQIKGLDITQNPYIEPPPICRNSGRYRLHWTPIGGYCYRGIEIPAINLAWDGLLPPDRSFCNSRKHLIWTQKP